MGLLKPSDGKKSGRFVNAPDNIVDAKGQPGIGSTKRGNKWATNKMDTQPPTKGDNPWKKVGTTKKPY